MNVPSGAGRVKSSTNSWRQPGRSPTGAWVDPVGDGDAVVGVGTGVLGGAVVGLGELTGVVAVLAEVVTAGTAAGLEVGVDGGEVDGAVADGVGVGLRDAVRRRCALFGPTLSAVPMAVQRWRRHSTAEWATRAAVVQPPSALAG